MTCPQNQIRWTGSDPASAVPLFADPVLDCLLASRSGIANVTSYWCGYEIFGFEHFNRSGTQRRLHRNCYLKVNRYRTGGRIRVTG
jgi:hypothetical protein